MYQTIESQPASMKTICANSYFLFSGLTLNSPTSGFYDFTELGAVAGLSAGTLAGEGLTKLIDKYYSPKGGVCE